MTVLVMTLRPSAATLLLKTPFSGSISVTRRPEVTIWSSVPRGWTCGVLKPHGPKNPTAIPEPVPTRAGNVLRFAAMRSPPLPPLPLRAGFPKSNTNWLSLGSRAKRSTAVSARKSCWVRESVEVVEVEVVEVAGAGAVPVPVAVVVAFRIS